MEFFNELFVLFSLYMVLLFSPFVEDANVKYNIGWLLLCMVCFNLIVNMLVMLYNTFVMAKNYVKKGIKIAKRKLLLKKQIKIGIRAVA